VCFYLATAMPQSSS